MKHFSYWANLELPEVFIELESAEKGLSGDHAKQRLKRDGPNTIDIKTDTALSIFMRQLKSPFNYLLIAAAIIALFVGEYSNTVLICILTFINIGIGFYQEFKAHRALILLRRYIPSTVRVLRDGKQVTISKENLVIGDIVILEAGSVVPADMRIIGGSLVIDESVLTGESQPVTKSSSTVSSKSHEIFKALNITFAGTHILSGAAQAIVVTTGNNTIFYTVTSGNTSTERISSYEKNLLDMSKSIVRLVIATVIIIFLVHLIIFRHIESLNLLIFFITLIVAIVPEALPTVVVFSLSRASLRLAKNHVVVKRLSSIDDLGDIEILCTDKTGTLTELRLTVDSIIAHDVNKCLLFSLLDTLALPNKVPTNTFDGLLFNYAGSEIKNGLNDFELIAHTAFDSFSMRTSTLVKDKNGKRLLVIKGAPDILLARSTHADGNLSLEQIKKEYTIHGQNGKRIIAVAYKELLQDRFDEKDEQGLTLLGFITMINPVKKDVAATIVTAQRMGITIKMITGDSKEVAGFVASQVGLVADKNSVMTGDTLISMSDTAFKQACFDNHVFARIDPKTKARIVNALQDGHEVGFLGEGINDIPALKQANVAIVVKEAADIARETADIILLEKNLSVLVNGIRYGRATFCNINKYIRCTLAGNFGNYYSLAIFSFLLPYLPMLPTQILLINLLSDFPLIAIASDNVDTSELRLPKSYDFKKIMPFLVLLGLVGTLSDMLFFAFFYSRPQELFRSLWFVLNLLSDVVLIFSVRTAGPMFRTARPSFALIITTCISSLIAVTFPYTSVGHTMFLFAAPSMTDFFIVLVIVVLYAILTELSKLLYARYRPGFHI